MQGGVKEEGMAQHPVLDPGSGGCTFGSWSEREESPHCFSGRMQLWNDGAQFLLGWLPFSAPSSAWLLTGPADRKGQRMEGPN